MHLISIGLDPTEELVETDDGILFRVSRTSLPYLVTNLLTEVAVWLEDRDLILEGIIDYQVLEPAHLLTSPACDRSVVDALALVWHHEIFTDAYDLAQSATHRTRSQRTVETEQIFIRSRKLHAVRLKTVYKLLESDAGICIFHTDKHCALSLVKGTVDRTVQTGLQVLISARQPQTVYQQIKLLREISALRLLHHLLDPDCLIGKES